MNILAVRPLADSAFTLDLAETVNLAAADKVAAALAAIRSALSKDELPGVIEVSSAFCSVTIYYDCQTIAQADLVMALRRVISDSVPLPPRSGRHWVLPCLYGAEAGIDLPDLSRHVALSESEIVSRHAAATFTVYTIGFLPGLPFLGDLPAELARPRRAEPRTVVPKGSVAIANRMCVIYPWSSPGGWHIIGCCPVPLFDIARPTPSLLEPGDKVRFASVTVDEFADLQAAVASGELDPSRFRVA